MYMNYPGGFKLEFGSPVTVLTTAATGGHSRHRRQGVFTGVVLAESQLDFKRGKHISISFAGMGEESSECESDYGEYEDCKDSETEETETTEYQKPFKKKKEEEFLVMALTQPSCPYVAGQIVWINVAEIVSIGAVCTSPVRR
ncbi:hypothetical protein SAMN04490178_11438 [Propionispora vibrioides]|uniref:Uncharacterized protein n=2 Tax=Propionispora vibrioides TaxID=112903 RepID=A0A1H8W5R2_9FIRM|nr:hypothetical protein SAMN04490178_11438 [Propionispora vibrioides]